VSRRELDAFVPFPPEAIEQSLVSRFEAQVASGPHRLALASARGRLSYAELDREANRLANALLDRRGPRHEPVALLLGQGNDAVIATLGALKAGKFYVPLEPGNPPERLRRLLADARPGALVTNAAYRGLAGGLAGSALAVVDVEGAGAYPDVRPNLSIPPHRLAHVIYTSGSTGEPKGVVQNHRNALQYARLHTNAYRVGPADRVTLLSSSAFLGAARDTFLALLNGASVFPYDVRREGVESVGPWLAREQITVYISVPTVFRRFAATLDEGARFPALRLLNLGGEPVLAADVELYRRHTGSACQFAANFGTTESGTFVLFFTDHTAALPEGIVPAGYLLDACEVSLLDADGRVVEGAGPGEIAVTSPFLPLGYLRRAELTRAVYRPAIGHRRARTYLTGDQGRRLADGCLVALGRGDGQIKVGGQRVELGEVEQALRKLPGVRDAAAAVHDLGAADRRVVAYLVLASSAPPAHELRRDLAERLPAAAVPWRIVRLEALPVTATGKLDRRALPAPGRERPELPVALVPPRSPVETAVASLWQEVLCLDEIGVHDDFLDLGGQSLQAAQIAARVAQRFAVALPTQTLLECRTVSELALAVVHALMEESPGADVDDVGGPGS
jgi:amino acid adenylation domain-containing protein